jgi:hypothetical protein
MRLTHVLAILGLAGCCYGQQQQPNVEVQREAMKKLDFLLGKWAGDASVSRGPGEPVKVRQTEEIEYRLDGLVMLVQGTGRNAEGKIVFQALATISYDDQTSKYRFRSHSDGAYLDTELKVTEKGFIWGFESGPLKVVNIMHVNERGHWMESTEVTFGSAPPRKSVQMLLRRQQ